ncbi:LysR substrate-binding domain-containing protein [Xenophilus arseniciresistens]|uniref:LysR substrate-binding domain-containing protein n=2 Tax=Xenophilus arseniciresistens TaxID=1283306 RepID=A0AAE3T1D1_9BURK|nr:LysR substrate-binding domain-containing protein [Xenophilus arseniciresistens]MDA7418445.1 LysR substrate-binding domain-containing protein [Xenophilus arseniciresistens]
MPMRSIPPIQCLVTFELLARLRSASRTADELCVTVSAVSHRIRQLEAHLGFKLFAVRGDFTLTADGTAYLANVREGLAAFQRMPARSGAQAATRLSVAVTPTFARVYVMPRLETFRNAYPEVELTFQVSIPLLDVTAEEADLEVRFGPGHYADRESRVVTHDRVTPACSPSYLKEFGPFEGFDTLAELQQARLIRSPLEPWSSWFAACGLALPEPYVGAQFNDLGLVYDAAASGFGVALVREEMGAAWFDSGRLVRLSPRSAPAPNANHICWKPGTLERWECAAFVDWMVG